MTWADGPMLAYDCESTGVDVFGDRIVTATVVRIEPGVEPKVRSTVINPGVEVPDGAAEVHGFTTERVRAEGKEPGPELEWIASDLVEAWKAGTPVVIANAPFDLTMLNAELARHGMATLEQRLSGLLVAPVIDPQCIDRTVDRYRPGKRTLTDLCEFYGCRLDGAHDATFDAIAAARIVWVLGRRAAQALVEPHMVRARYADRPRQAGHITNAFASMGRMSLMELHAQQVDWYAAKARDFAGYLFREANEAEHRAGMAGDPAERETLLTDVAELRRRAEDVSTEWPIRPLRAVAA